MWEGKESAPDPGGTQGGDPSTGSSSSNQELIDLKDQFEQQQVLIAQLKEMLRKTEQKTVSEEKVEEYASTLTRMSARVKKNRMQRGEVLDDSITDTPASEKIMLLRQQLEENKLRLAQRGKFQKDIEETVIQLRAQLDDSQQLISQTPLNLSFAEAKIENYSAESTSEELFNLLVIRDRKLTELNIKLQKLEANVIDLQENVKEKDSVIDARTKAITLMTESLSKKGKHTLDTLDDTKEQMRKMQENFIALEMDMKSEKQNLLDELDNKNAFIATLQDSYRELQNTNTQLQTEIETFKVKLSNTAAGDTGPLINRINDLENELTQKISDLNKLSTDLQQKNDEIEQLQQTHSSLEIDCATMRNEIATSNEKLEILNSRVQELQELNSELTKSSSETISPRDSPHRSSKKGKRGQKGVLKSKDTSELQKNLDKLKEECEQYRIKVAESDIIIQELNLTISELKNAKEEVQQEPEDIAKLKKQLEESNKNMIKIKATHKGKIKELNKKIEELKSLSSGNEKLVEYQNEISKLKEQINEREKENEKLISNSTAGMSTKDRIKELETQLFEQSELLDTKNQSLDTLEAQLKSYKTELSSLSERFNKLSHIENDQVASEMTSIHFEEQLDNLQLEKNALEEQNQLIAQEKEALLEKIDSILKERQELNIKLENYMQENMDLIDKLEKLSAEKVSSAESIEIVEGLTQQEKLELEAYQQSLDMVSDTMTDNLQNPELNDSVNQLTEETSDLLQKIELFTEERREVMEKMEALTADNNHLNLRIQEIENNRDILSETYEQLQNEKEIIEQERNALKLLESELNNEINQLKKENEVLKQEIQRSDDESKFEPLVSNESQEHTNSELQKHIDEYRSLIEIQKCEINELKIELLSLKNLPAANRELHDKVGALQKQFETVMSENEKLNKIVKEQTEIMSEKQEIQQELIETQKRIANFQSKLEENVVELENYKSIIEENRDELISSSNVIVELQSKVQKKQDEVSHYENEISHLNSVIAELNSTLSHLENVNEKHSNYSDTIEVMSAQLQELKILLNDNISQIEVYQEELQQNSGTIAKLNGQLKELNNKLLDVEHELECKDDEIKKLLKERDNKELMITSLQSELKEKDDALQKVCQSLNEKCIALNQQIEQNAGSLDKLSTVTELEIKNKEQLEKMKKLAANLKKKTSAYAELEQKCNDLSNNLQEEVQTQNQLRLTVEKLQSNNKSLLEQLEEVEEQHTKTSEELSTKTNNLNELTHEIADLRAVYENLQTAKQQFETQLHELRRESELLSSNESNRLNMEINEKNEIIRNLSQQLEDVQYQAGTNSNALEAKIQEMELVVENLETELSKYKDKVNNLEEFVSAVEERRLSLEKKTVELGEQLLEKSNSYEQISQAEDMLEQRLAALMEHDEQIGNRLHESLAENQELLERIQRLLEENEELKLHLSSATEKNLESSLSLNQFSEMQSEIAKIRESMAEKEIQLKRINEDYEKKLREKNEEIESLETELQSQLQLLEDERKALLIQCEHLQDQLQEHSEKQVQLTEGIEQYKQKLDQQQVDFEDHIREFEILSEQNKHNLAIIEQHATNCEQLKNQNEELRELIVIKDNEAQGHQRDRIQLEEKLREYERLHLELREHNLKLKEDIELSKSKIEPEESQAIATFVWPGSTSNDPFDFITKPEVSEPIVQSTSEPLLENKQDAISSDTFNELLEKVKTLEFMLYNTEKEKEEILLQSQELTNEIARLIFEKQHYTPELQPTQVDSSTNFKAPVSGNDLELQIVSPEQTVFTQTDAEQLHKVEFENVNPYVDSPDSELPIAEEMCQTKSTYLCYAEDETNTPKETFDENDDGWGCGADEAKLEDDYRQSLGASTTNPNLNLHMEELEERNKMLELERERHLEEIKQLQIKSGKLIKKLKEFKNVNEKLNADLKNSDFGGLDDAIQDELKSQIERLDKRIKDINGELQKEKAEKSNLHQKIQTLQATNDRMTETKEKHEVDYIVLQRQNRELAAKLEQLEWNNDSPAHAQSETINLSAPAEPLHSNVQELNDTIKELILDNEELQMLLEEQRTLRINAEKSKSVEPILTNVKTEQEYLEVVAEKNNLNVQLTTAVSEKEQVQEALNNLAKINEELNIRAHSLSQDKTDLENRLLQIQSMLHQKKTVESQTSLSSQEIESFSHKISELNEHVTVLRKTCEELQSENSRLLEMNGNLTVLQENNGDLAQQLQRKDVQIQELTTALHASDEKISEMDRKLQESQELNKNNNQLVNELQLKNVEILDKTAQLEEAAVERASYETSLQQLAEEWSQRVDQRGLDVAESWKLHLEEQENEFVQIQKQLQKEIQDLEEKCNVLDNENNELRKNVDAEIRNEVDKISALQQQISSRQIYINELTQTLQENQSALNEQQQRNANYEVSVAQLTKQIDEKETELLQLRSHFTALQAEIEALKVRSDELLQKSNAADEIQRQLDEQINLNNKIKQELNEKQEEFVQMCAVQQEKDTAVTQLADQLDQINSLRQSDFVKVAGLEAHIQELMKQLEQDKISAVELLNNHISYFAQQNEDTASKDTKINDLTNEVIRLNAVLEEKEAEFDSSASLEQTADNKISELVIEVNNLKLFLSEREKDYQHQLETLNQESLQKQTEQKMSYEKLLLAKDSDLEIMNVQLQEQVQNIEALNSIIHDRDSEIITLKIELDSKVKECDALNSQLYEDNELHKEENTQLKELSQIIEDQVLKIESLKQELFEKSKNYDSLIAELDLRKSSVEQRQSYQPSDKVLETPKLESTNTDNLDVSTRAELDLMSYVLHHRDVRCEELTVELTQLLEERDILQLKLSNAIREKEQLRRKYEPELATANTSDDINPSAVPSPAPPIVASASTSQTEESTESLEHLKKKLSQLKSVGYKKDKTLVDDQETRRLLEMRVMQEHRDIASMLPPEAAARLMQEASYTLWQHSEQTKKNNAKDLRAVYENWKAARQQFEMQLHEFRREFLSSNRSKRLNMEINEKNEIIRNLSQQLKDVPYQAGTNSNALEAKIQEMEIVISNQEKELSKYKDKVNILEEFVSAIEERRLSLEKKTVELGEQLPENSNSYEEISQAKDMLEQRLAALMEHEQIGNRLHESLAENQELLECIQRLLEENEELKLHLSSATEKNLESSLNLNQFSEMQSEIAKMRESMTEKEIQLKRINEDHEKKRKALIIQCEHLQDQLQKHSEKQVQLTEGIEQYKQKLDQQQVDFENHIREFEILSEQNKHNLAVIEQHAINCEQLKNQNEELRELIVIKDNEAQGHQRDHIQLEEKLREYERLHLELREHNLKLKEDIELSKSKIEPEESQAIATFVWPGSTSNDPFDFITKPEVSEPIVQSTSEPLLENKQDAISSDTLNELLEMVKTLEFMLYNTEKEILLQALTNEIGRLIFAKPHYTSEL